MLQLFRRFPIIRPLFRLLSSSNTNVNLSTTQKELFEINKLMNTYNNTHIPIRTFALFEWMLNIINVKPDFHCYLQIIRACGELNNLTICQKIHQFIQNDRTLSANDYYQLQVKLIYMYAKIKQIDLAEQLFHHVKTTQNLPIDISLFGTMFKGYNMNGQAEKTIQLYEKEMLNKPSMQLDAISATCVLSACSDCHRLDIGRFIHNEVVRLKLLDPPNLRLATAIIDMYCNCGSIDRARELFNQLLPIVDHVAYSILMKAYLSLNQPIQVLTLFNQLQSSSVRPDAGLYINVIHACRQLGLKHQAEHIHRSIPCHIIEKNPSLQTALIDMHAHSLQLDEACRLFNLLEQKDNHSLASLIHGYAIHGQGQQALELFQEMESKIKFNEQVYQMILYACALTGGLVNEARRIYETMPDKYKTPKVAAALVSTLARASLFDEVQSFISQYKSTSENVSPLWSAFFMVCYHSGNLQYAKLIYNQMNKVPLLSLLFSDMTNSLPSTKIINYFHQQSPDVCWTEIENDQKTGYLVYEYHENWEAGQSDLKRLFCGHTTVRLAVEQHFISNASPTVLQLTKTKPICHDCHEELKQLTLLKQCDIILRDESRVHHFHHGKCSCHDKY